MKSRFIIALIALTVISCENKENKSSNVSKDSTHQSVTIDNKDYLEQNESDTIAKELPYFDSTKMFKNGEDGYQDTFSLDNIKFRIVHHDTLYDGIVQKFQEGKWVDVLSFENLGNHNSYSYREDLNNDGYNDICLNWKWDIETFFYDPKQKTFLKKSIKLSYDWLLLDKEKSIYCNFEQGKTADATSELYTINNYEQLVLAHIEFKSKTNDNQQLDKAVLYKGKTKIEEVKINNTEDFEYRKWWKENYKRVL